MNNFTSSPTRSLTIINTLLALVCFGMSYLPFSLINRRIFYCALAFGFAGSVIALCLALQKRAYLLAGFNVLLIAGGACLYLIASFAEAMSHIS